MPPRQSILLDEGALQNALRQKGSLRGDSRGDHHIEGTPSTFNVSLHRPLGKILLDENRLQQALQAKAERRKAAEDSTERRRLARSSMDHVIDSPWMSTVSSKPSRPQRKSLVQTQQSQRIEDLSVVNETESMSESTSTIHGEPRRVHKPVVRRIKKKKKSEHKLVTETTAPSDVTLLSQPSTTEIKSRSDPPRPTLPAHMAQTPPAHPQGVMEELMQRVAMKKSESQRGTHTKKKDDKSMVPPPPKRIIEVTNEPPRPKSSINIVHTSSTPPRPVAGKMVRRVSRKKSNSKIIPEHTTTNDATTMPNHSILSKEMDDLPPPRPYKRDQISSNQINPLRSEDTSATRTTTRPPLPPNLKTPSKRSIHTASTAKGSNDNISMMEDPNSHTSNDSQLVVPRSHSQPQNWSNIPIPNSSDHSQPMSWGSIPIPSSSDQPASFHGQPPSWSVRNQAQTGFSPNQYITKETMTQYTNNLGGVQTVATTTKIFHDKAKNDPDLKVFFKKIRWEHVRNEFIILANLQVPDRFDENIKWILEHHCRLLENGADIDRLVAIWESAIESSWLENRMDDARQLLVGPSRVIFNLKALERHYAMHQKALRAAARLLRSQPEPTNTNEPATKGGILSRLRRGKQ